MYFILHFSSCYGNVAAFNVSLCRVGFLPVHISNFVISFFFTDS